MIYNLVEAAQEFLSEVVSQGQSQESVSIASHFIVETTMCLSCLYYLSSSLGVENWMS